MRLPERIFFLMIVILGLLCCGCKPATVSPERAKVVIVVAPQYCCDEELFRLKAVFEKNNIGVITVGTTPAMAKGERLGMTVKPDTTLDKINMNDFDGIVIGSGTGCKEFLWQDESLREIIRLVFSQNKLIAASCNAPVVLARVGILKGKQATVWANPEAIAELERAGAIYKDEPVVVDGNIVTGRDLKALERFAEAIAQRLLK